MYASNHDFENIYLHVILTATGQTGTHACPESLDHRLGTSDLGQILQLGATKKAKATVEDAQQPLYAEFRSLPTGRSLTDAERAKSNRYLAPPVFGFLSSHQYCSHCSNSVIWTLCLKSHCTVFIIAFLGVINYMNVFISFCNVYDVCSLCALLFKSKLSFWDSKDFSIQCYIKSHIVQSYAGLIETEKYRQIFNKVPKFFQKFMFLKGWIQLT